MLDLSDVPVKHRGDFGIEFLTLPNAERDEKCTNHRRKALHQVPCAKAIASLDSLCGEHNKNDFKAIQKPILGLQCSYFFVREYEEALSVELTSSQAKI